MLGRFTDLQRHKKNTELKKEKERTRKRTELGEEEQEHDNGGGDGDEAAGESTAVEILVDFGIGVQTPKLAHYIVHFRFALILRHFFFFFFFLFLDRSELNNNYVPKN